VSLFRRPPSFLAKSALVSAYISLAIVVGANVSACLGDSAPCILKTPAAWIYWAPTFIAVWAAAFLVRWLFGPAKESK